MNRPETRVRYARGEVATIGREIYERDIKAVVESEHQGELLVMDILTGEYVMDKDDVVVTRRAMEKFPDGVRFAVRIGSRPSD